MKTNKIKAVIFDLDGTLLNTLCDLCDSTNDAMDAIGAPRRTMDEVRSFVGNGIRMLMVRAVPGGDENPLFDVAMNAFVESYKKNCANKTKPYDRIPQLLSRLSDDGYRLAVVSNKADFAVKTLVSDYFGDVISVAIGEKESEGVKKKPAPDTVIAALRALDCEKENAVYVGDSEVNIMTAENAEMRCISVDWGFRGRDALTAAGATEIVSSPEELLKAIEK